MPTINFSGMASGLPANLVDQLIQAERMPIHNMEARKAKTENKLKLVSELESKVSAVTGSLGELASTKGFQDMKVISGDQGIITGVVDPELAKSGTWNIEVVQLAQKAAAMTNGFPDKDRTEIGVGYFRFKTPEGNKEVYISGSNNTLEGAAQAINQANVGVRASVIQDSEDKDRPFKMLLSSDHVGADGSIEYPRLYFLDGDQDIYFEGHRPAKNGIVKVDGFEVQVSDNTLNDLIPGVTLDLRQAAPGRQVSVTVKEDLEVVSGKIKSFVDAYNGVLSFIQSQNKMDQNTDTSQTLGGDTILRSVESRMRGLIMNSQVGLEGPIQRIGQLGIEFNRNGTLNFNEEKFNKTLSSNPEAVKNFLTGDGFNVGFIPSVRREVGNLLNQAFGPITNRKRNLQDEIRRTDQRIEAKERQLVKKEDQLRRKFAAMEEAVSRLKTQGASLGQMGGGGLLASMGGM